MKKSLTALSISFLFSFAESAVLQSLNIELKVRLFHNLTLSDLLSGEFCADNLLQMLKVLKSNMTIDLIVFIVVIMN
jgi:hypothetical protein